MEKETFAVEIPIPSVISIAGMEKNIGKTSLLNWLASVWAEHGQSTLLTSIGHEGSVLDSPEGDTQDTRKKPVIEFRKGNFALTGERLIHNPSLLEVIEIFPVVTVAGRLLLVKAISDTTVEIVNAGSLELLATIVQNFLSKRVCDRVLIDGALNRWSHTHSKLADYVLIVTGAEVVGTQEEILKKTKFLVHRLQEIPCAENVRNRILSALQKGTRCLILKEKEFFSYPFSVLENPEILDHCSPEDMLFTEGVLTTGILQKILQRGKPIGIIVRDGSCIQMDEIVFERAKKKGNGVSVIFPIAVRGIFVNHQAKNRNLPFPDFLEKLKKELPHQLIFDLFEVTY